MLNVKKNTKLVMTITTAIVGLFVAGCSLSPVSLSPSISVGSVAASSLKGRTIYVKVNDSRASKDVGSVIIKEETTSLESSTAVNTVVKNSIVNTLRKYGMTIVDSIGKSDNQMFVTVRDFEYVYPRSDSSAESSMALRVSIAGERATHENIVSAWARYEIENPGGGDVRNALNDVSSRALQSALTEPKMISVLAGNR